MSRYLNKFKACDELNISLKELKNYEKEDKLSTTTCKCGNKLYNVSQINEKYKPSNVKNNIIYCKNKYDSNSYENHKLFIKKLEDEYRDYYVKNDTVFSEDKNSYLKEILDEAYANNINKIIIITNNVFNEQYYSSLDYILRKYSSAEVLYKSIEELGFGDIVIKKEANGLDSKLHADEPYVIILMILLILSALYLT